MTVEKRADGTVIKRKGGNELREIVKPGAGGSYDLEAIKDHVDTPESPLEEEEEEESLPIFASMEDIETLPMALSSDEDESPEVCAIVSAIGVVTIAQIIS